MRLSEVIGHGGLPRLLARLIGRGRLPHALLFEGRPGSGRRTLARAVAQALLCHDPQQGDACGRCAACVVQVAGTHPDCSELPGEDEAADLPVDLVRSVVVDAAFTSPLMGRAKVFVLPAIERLGTAAANTLLKVLEEPPRGTHLVMTTLSAASVLKTIRSRAQLYRVPTLSANEVARILVGQGVPASDAERRAQVAHGSVRGGDAAAAAVPLEDLAILAGGDLDPARVAAVVARLPQKLGEDAGERTLAGEQRRVLARWLEALVQHERRSLSGADAEAVAERIERILRLIGDLDRHLSPHLVVEGLALPVR